MTPHNPNDTDSTAGAQLEILQAVLDALAEPAALLAPDGAIVAVNDQWLKTARVEEIQLFNVGDNYYDSIRSFTENINIRMEKFKDDLERMLIEGTDRLEAELAEDSTLGGEAFRVDLRRTTLNNEDYILVRGRNVTHLNDLKREMQSLTLHILMEQTKERRRIARDLHDSTAQLLVGLQLNLMQLRSDKDSQAEEAIVEHRAPILAQCFKNVEALQTELHELGLRDLAHRGIADPLTELASSFAASTGLQIDCRVSIDSEPPPSVAIAIYRIVQEALANAYRHSHGNTVEVSLSTSDEVAHLTIKDNGGETAMPWPGPTRLPGVGLSSMKERAAECGGNLEIMLDDHGCTIDAVFPVVSTVAQPGCS